MITFLSSKVSPTIANGGVLRTKGALFATGQRGAARVNGSRTAIGRGMPSCGEPGPPERHRASPGSRDGRHSGDVVLAGRHTVRCPGRGPMASSAPSCLHGFPDQPEGQAGRIALPGEQAGRLPGARLGRLPAGARHLLLDQAPGGGDLLLGVEGVDRLADLLALDAAAPELGGKRPPGQPAAMVPGLDPGPGERRVVDQASVGEPAQHGFGGFGGHAAAAASPAPAAPWSWAPAVSSRRQISLAWASGSAVAGGRCCLRDLRRWLRGRRLCVARPWTVTPGAA